MIINTFIFTTSNSYINSSSIRIIRFYLECWSIRFNTIIIIYWFFSITISFNFSIFYIKYTWFNGKPCISTIECCTFNIPFSITCCINCISFSSYTSSFININNWAIFFIFDISMNINAMSFITSTINHRN